MRSTFVVMMVVVMSGCAGTPTSPAQNATGTAISIGSEGATTEARIDTSFGHGGVELSAMLTGAAEVPGPGDPDGAGTARITLNAGQGEVCFALAVTGIAPAGASHIHVGAPTVAGPVVVTLAPPPATGSSTACVSANEDLVRQIAGDPGAYYVNVHNAAFPAGAIRGQLSK